MNAHVSPIPMPLPAGMQRGTLSCLFLEHYPSPHSKKYGGYVTEDGHATDCTTRMIERAVSTSLPAGESLCFQQQFDWWADLYDGPHPLKVGKANFNFTVHFYKRLSKEEQVRWWDSKVGVLKWVIVDEIIERGRDGARCFISGKEPLKWWPKLLNEAVPMAIAEASAFLKRDVTYNISYASQSSGILPPLEPIAVGKPPPSCGDREVQHPCGALIAMSLEHRARLDALTKWVQGPILNSTAVTYFQSCTPKYGDGYSEAERGMLLADARAREGGYKGPSPLEVTLTAAQHAARKEAISRCMRAVQCGGRKAVENKLKKDIAQVTDTEFSTLLADARARTEFSTLLADARAREGGYKGPSPLEVTLTAAQHAARKEAISRCMRAVQRGGREAVENKLKKDIAQVTDTEFSTLFADARAHEGGYKGPSPLETTLTAAQHAARKEAILRGMRAVMCGGRKAVENKLKKDIAQVTDTELSTLLADARAHEGGYKGPSPLETTLTVAQHAVRKEAISRAHLKRGKELVEQAMTDPEAAAKSKAIAVSGLTSHGNKRRGQGDRGGAQVRHIKGGVRKTKPIMALPAEVTEQAARDHYSTCGLSAENPLARCSTCKCWNILYPVFADDLSRASGPRRQHTKRISKKNAFCGKFKAV